MKRQVLERDGRCVICGANDGQPVAHIVARSHGGLGIPENIVTLCPGATTDTTRQPNGT